MELKDIVNFIKEYRSSSSEEQYIHLISIQTNEKNNSFLKRLSDKQCLKERFIDTDNKAQNILNVDVKWVNLPSIGIFRTKSDFISFNQIYEKTEFYIEEIDCFNDSDNIFINLYNEIKRLSESLKICSSYAAEDNDFKHLIFINPQMGIDITIEYELDDIEYNNIETHVAILKEFTNVLQEKNEKQKFYLNEILNFLNDKKLKRFGDILRNIMTIQERAINGYDFYLSNFSANKFKYEIDSKAIDFTSKIQNVINDAQTKLITIPTAFILASTNIEYSSSEIWCVKNISIIVGLYIFSMLICQFLQNQKTILDFIESDVEDFRTEFKDKDLETISVRFNKVDIALKKQKRRLRYIHFILWAIPIILSILLLIIKINSSCFIQKTHILTILQYIWSGIKILICA